VPSRPWNEVPTISRFHGIAIEMYWNDHPSPHFHVFVAGRSAKVSIEDQSLLEGSLPRRQLRMVRKWAAVHQKELEENWRRARDRESLVPIEPWH
jgi:hypothetical protein